jgi:predicted RNA-binding protein YlxR (DUF448 family)
VRLFCSLRSPAAEIAELSRPDRRSGCKWRFGCRVRVQWLEVSRSVPHAQTSSPPVPPVRTCVGCRVRASKSDLVRVVVGPEPATGQPGSATVLRIDAGIGLPGRGAHLHPWSACLELAQRRQAFVRALKLHGPVDVEQVSIYLTGWDERSTTSTSTTSTSTIGTTATSPEHPARADQEAGRVDS